MNIFNEIRLREELVLTFKAELQMFFPENGCSACDEFDNGNIILRKKINDFVKGLEGQITENEMKIKILNQKIDAVTAGDNELKQICAMRLAGKNWMQISEEIYGYASNDTGSCPAYQKAYRAFGKKKLWK